MGNCWLQAQSSSLPTPSQETPAGPEEAHPAKITVALRDLCVRLRKIATAAFVRIAKANLEPLRYATSTDDAEVAEFAGDMLKRTALS
jgi:hypothetical protein